MLNEREHTPASAPVGMNSNGHYDVIVVGAGIVGLSTAMEFLRRLPRLRLLVLEKEDGLARPQLRKNRFVWRNYCVEVNATAFLECGFLAATNSAKSNLTAPVFGPCMF